MHKHQAIFLAVMTAVSGFALADEPAVTPNADAQVLRGTNQIIPQADAYDLISKGEGTMSATYYGRNRQAQWDYPVPKDKHDITVNTLNLALAYRSGFAWDKVGFDVSAFTAQKLASGKGWSEILNHDVNDTDNGDQPGGVDKSYSVISQAAIKFRSGADGQGVSLRAGYTPISVGTLGTGGGLQSHAYRGAEFKYRFGDFEIGYGWADQFRNEWDNRFRDITTSWEQGRATGSTAQTIGYVNSVGFRYAPKDGFIDVGVGEGEDYRRNAQIAGSYTWQLSGGDKLTATGYFYTGKDIANGLTKNASPKTDYHTSGSVSYSSNSGFTFLGGLGYTKAPNNTDGAANEANFRMTGWANSDNRNFIQTWGQLDDFVWDGMTVIKLGVNYDFGKIGVPGLSAGISGNYATGANYLNAQQQKNTAKFSEVDLSIGYSVQSGVLKGASIGVYPAWLKVGGFVGDKSDRNDVKVVASYSKNF